MRLRRVRFIIATFQVNTTTGLLCGHSSHSKKHVVIEGVPPGTENQKLVVSAPWCSNSKA